MYPIITVEHRVHSPRLALPEHEGTRRVIIALHIHQGFLLVLVISQNMGIFEDYQIAKMFFMQNRWSAI